MSASHLLTPCGQGVAWASEPGEDSPGGCSVQRTHTHYFISGPGQRVFGHHADRLGRCRGLKRGRRPATLLRDLPAWAD